MSNTQIKSISSAINEVAERLASIDHPMAEQLFRIAGAVQATPRTAQNFNPAYEVGGPNYNMQVQPASGGGSQPNMHPGIESYVQPMANGTPAVDDRKTHKLTCTLKAPRDISESDMMNYILGIGPELKVDVESFQWAKSEPKPMAGGR